MDLFEAKKIAIELMQKHGVLDMRYYFQFNNRKRAAGLCSYRKRTIELSKHITALADEKDVIDTIIHEIAHALCPRQNHNHIWKAKYLELGGNGKRCYSMESSLGVAYKSIAKYKGVCPNGHKHARNRKPNDQSCGACSRKYNPKFIITWTLNS